MTTFSEAIVNYPDGQLNVNAPPEATFLSGFIPETAANRGQPLPAQWLNYLFRTIFRLFNRDKITDSAGVSLFPYADSMIRLEAVDRADINKFIVAVGFKDAVGTLHSLKVIASATLTLGTPTTNGDQPVLGGSGAVRVVGYSRQIGEL